jgi:hypothetical protein
MTASRDPLPGTLDARRPDVSCAGREQAGAIQRARTTDA